MDDLNEKVEPLYVKGCHWAGKYYKNSRETAKKRKQTFESAKKEYLSIRRRHEQQLHLKSGDNNIESKLKRSHSRYKTAERRYFQKSLMDAVKFNGWDIDVYQIEKFSSIIAVMIFGILILLNIMLLIRGSSMLMYVLPTSLVLPVVIYSFLLSYPEIVSNRMKVRTIGRTPEAINFLSMSMRVTPSLNRAIEFTAKNMDEPLGTGFKTVLWNVMMRKFHSIEDSFNAFALECGDWNEDFKRGLYLIKAAGLERSKEGLNRTLDKANELVIEGTKERIGTYVSSLSGPTTILFAMGVLFPMLIGAMLPILSISSPSSLSSYGEVSTSTTPPPTIEVGALMILIIPFLTFVFSWNILGKRPGTYRAPDNSRIGLITFQDIAVVSSILAIVLLLGHSLSNVILLPMMVMVFGISLGLLVFRRAKPLKKRRNQVWDLEKVFPDALFQLGNHISDGEPLETALGKVGRSMIGTEVGTLFLDIEKRMRFTREPLTTILFGDEGLLKGSPSPLIKGTMQTVIEVVQKDSRNAGQTIVNISTYLRDLKRMEHDIQTSIRSITDMARGTALVFSPLVMGITCGLYVLLGDSFSSMELGFSMIQPEHFILIIGIYLALTVAIILYFTTGMMYGQDNVQFAYELGYGLPMASIIFFLVALGSMEYMI